MIMINFIWKDMVMKKENIIMPNYENCILGTITSILKYYNVETKHKSSEKIDKILQQKEYKNVIVLLLDGLGEYILNEDLPNGYLKSNQIDCVTSVYPSTTTAALTTYYSGKPPYETGWIAWSQYFKEYGRALDMFSHNESYMREPLKKPLIDVFKTIVNYESIFEQIENAIKQAIFSNELKEEDMLPSVRSLANDLKISFLTVKRAYDELEQAGFIKTVQGKGSFVAPKNLELIREEKLKEIQDYIEKIYDISKISNISEEEIKELFKMIFEGDF